MSVACRLLAAVEYVRCRLKGNRKKYCTDKAFARKFNCEWPKKYGRR